jgi:uncharacterized membrane protein YdbT with pleckstrin-like domain
VPEVHAMSYYAKVLQPDERVMYVGHLHWILYGNAIIFGILTVIALGFALSLPQDQRFLALIGSAILGILTIIFVVRAWFHQWITEIVVTDKRIIYKRGFIARNTQEMNITKVETVDVSQGIWGRILGYGTVGVIGTGASLERMQYVASPLQMRNAIIVG